MDLDETRAPEAVLDESPPGDYVERLVWWRRMVPEDSELREYAVPLVPNDRQVIGRDEEKLTMRAALARPELCNVMLLGDAGSGKTTLVQAVMEQDVDRVYLEVNLSKMSATEGSGTDGATEMATRVKELFDQAEDFTRRTGIELVLFMDEFHQLVVLSPPAVEAIKPKLADAGTRGIRVVAATTYPEFHKYVNGNTPLVQRFYRISLPEPDRATTISILRGYARKYGVEHFFPGDQLLEMIYDYTQRHMPSDSQPRKSIGLLDAMVGWHNMGRTINKQLLADVMRSTMNVNVEHQVDAASIKAQLDKAVLSQDLATSSIERRLQLCVANLNDEDKPLSSFLFTGSTGVGKATTDATPIPVWRPEGELRWVNAGQIRPGDVTYGRDGRRQIVRGVFPQGRRQVYRVKLVDGRHLDVSAEHLWAVYTAKRSRELGPTIYTTASLMARGLVTRTRGGVPQPKYYLPMNGPVQWPEADQIADAYCVGVALVATTAGADLRGFLGERPDVAAEVESRGDWSVAVREAARVGRGRLPVEYACGSIWQRWELVRGIFDACGSIASADGDRYALRALLASAHLARQVRTLLFSLGIASTTEQVGPEVWELTVAASNEDKAEFFLCSKHHAAAERARGVARKRSRRTEYVGIESIEVLDRLEPMTCIWVDDDEHLYQAGEFVVTHNTELAKQMANLVIGEGRTNMVRFDMTEFSQANSMERFRSDLTQAVVNRGHCVLLLDEIEKAHGEVIRLLMQVLDDGRLSDDYGRTVSFTNTYVVITTNAASDIYRQINRYDTDDTGSGEPMRKFESLIRKAISEGQELNKFPPELLGRIDTLVPFQPLSEQTLRRITRKKLVVMVQDVWRKHRVRVGVSDDVIEYVVGDQTDLDSNTGGGARGLDSIITNQVTTAVAEHLNRHPEHTHLHVGVEGEMRTSDKKRLKSTARISVIALQP